MFRRLYISHHQACRLMTPIDQSVFVVTIRPAFQQIHNFFLELKYSLLQYSKVKLLNLTLIKKTLVHILNVFEFSLISFFHPSLGLPSCIFPFMFPMKDLYRKG
jgi:hypothetical protein